MGDSVLSMSPSKSKGQDGKRGPTPAFDELKAELLKRKACALEDVPSLIEELDNTTPKELRNVPSLEEEAEMERAKEDMPAPPSCGGISRHVDSLELYRARK